MKKLIVGLTGGIASGKSTVGKIFGELGVTVIDADQLGREVVLPGTSGLQEVIATFGEDYLTEEGTLNREKLGRLVFADSESRMKLNAITHPRVRQLYADRIAAANQSSTPYIVYESALLVELELYKTMDLVIVVSASPELQVARVMKRNKLTESEARDRLASQLPLDKKVAVAHHVILNDNDRDALRARTLEVHEKLMLQESSGVATREWTETPHL